MWPHPIDANTHATLCHLIETNFMARDDLYAAADQLDEDSPREVCRRLAEILAAHAIELQQIMACCGAEVPDLTADGDDHEAPMSGPDGLHRAPGDVLQSAARSEHFVMQEYERAMQQTFDREAEGLLRRQQRDIAFSEHVLRCMQLAPRS